MNRKYIPKSRKLKASKKYIKEFEAKLKEHFYRYGTLCVPNFLYVAMALNVEPDERVEECLKFLDKTNKADVRINPKTMTWDIDYIPF